MRKLEPLESILNKQYIVTMPDGSRWAIPVRVIAESRAKHYAFEFDGDVKKSLKKDTIPLFESDDYEIGDWAKNNMNWDDVKAFAVQRPRKENATIDWEGGWSNGEVQIE